MVLESPPMKDLLPPQDSVVDFIQFINEVAS